MPVAGGKEWRVEFDKRVDSGASFDRAKLHYTKILIKNSTKMHKIRTDR